MKVEFATEFAKDIRCVTNAKLRARIEAAILSLERASRLQGFPQLEKLKGSSRAFRIRFGDYRLGLFVDGETVVLSRFLHRREIYRYFP